MELLPPDHRPKRNFRRLLQALAVGAAAGLAYGALAGYFTDDPSLLWLVPMGGAFAGFLVWTQSPNVLWAREPDEAEEARLKKPKP